MPLSTLIERMFSNSEANLYGCFSFPICLCFTSNLFYVSKVKLSLFLCLICGKNSAGSNPPPMYTEMLPGNQMLALIITSVTETMAGEYICLASYARTEQLEARVDIQTYGKFCLLTMKMTSFILNFDWFVLTKMFIFIKKIVPITWRNAPQNQYTVAAKDYVVQCDVTSNPAPAVDWLRNGDQVIRIYGF